MENVKVELGLYKHFKGDTYLVEGTAIHSETLEEMVVYRAQYGEQQLFVRPLAMFVEQVEADGKKVPRFRKFDDHDLQEHTANMIGKFISGFLFNHKDNDK